MSVHACAHRQWGFLLLTRSLVHGRTGTRRCWQEKDLSICRRWYLNRRQQKPWSQRSHVLMSPPEEGSKICGGPMRCWSLRHSAVRVGSAGCYCKAAAEEERQIPHMPQFKENQILNRPRFTPLKRTRTYTQSEPGLVCPVESDSPSVTEAMMEWMLRDSSESGWWLGGTNSGTFLCSVFQF